MRPQADSDASSATRLVNQLMARYFARLAEAVSDADLRFRFWQHLEAHDVPTPRTAATLTWDDFLRAVKSVLSTQRIAALGLRFGSLLRLADYGVAGLAVASAPTYRSAVKIAATHAAYIAPQVLVRSEMKIARGRVTRTYVETHAEPWVGTYLIEQEIASSLRLMRDILPQADLRHCKTSFAYSKPKYAHLYPQFLQCRSEFDSDYNQLVFPERWLDYSLETADPMLGRLMEQQCRLVIDRLSRHGGLADRTRRLLMANIGRTPSIADAAQFLGMSVHGFRRNLYEAGTSYKEIVYSVRMERAVEFLIETAYPLQEIAFLLGYDHGPNFFAAFRKYWGTTPTEFRRQRLSPSLVNR